MRKMGFLSIYIYNFPREKRVNERVWDLKNPKIKVRSRRSERRRILIFRL